MDSFDILVIVLSITLFLLLVSMLAVTVIAYKAMKRIMHVIDTLDTTVQNVEQFSHKLKAVGDMSMVGSALNSIAKLVKDKKKG